MSDEKKKEAPKAPYTVRAVTEGLREWKFEWAMTFAGLVIDHFRDHCMETENTIMAPPRTEQVVEMVRALICASEDFEEATKE